MSQVAIVHCDSYDYEQVEAAVKRGLSLIGGVRSFIKPGEKILLKPNLLTGEPPEKCVTTHPSVFKAVGALLLQEGAIISYGDSPGWGSPQGAARKSGIAEAAQELGIELADFRNGEEVYFAEGIQNKKFVIAQGALASDGIVSLPKLKTHALTRLTGGIKNQFGCVPGILKGEYHVKLPDLNNFAQMLIDLNHLLHPRLFVMDGIMAMEGNGPRNGRPRKLDVLLFSSDPVALDATVCRLVGLQPETIPTLTLGLKAGLGTYRAEDIELLGDTMGSLRVADFEVKKESGGKARKMPGWLTNLLVARPVINQEKCCQCGVCTEVCPVNPKALGWNDLDHKRPPVYNYDRCIRCYCCQELCPEGAITPIVPALRRSMRWFKK
ncbi:MAG: DUF362 domain-containing protein [Syntrophomonadaceae bacterium]|nr:DUF362 domain-containing protein [Syntrophomonadaceae bacterium]